MGPVSIWGQDGDAVAEDICLIVCDALSVLSKQLLIFLLYFYNIYIYIYLRLYSGFYIVIKI